MLGNCAARMLRTYLGKKLTHGCVSKSYMAYESTYHQYSSNTERNTRQSSW